MQVIYQCQICKEIVEERPPEWCGICGGHRIIVKRLTLSEDRLELEKAG